MSVSGHVVATEKPVIGEDSFYFLAQEINEALIDHGVKPGNGAAIPLVANGRSLGVLDVIGTPTEGFDDNDVSLLSAFADQAGKPGS